VLNRAVIRKALVPDRWYTVTELFELLACYITPEAALRYAGQKHVPATAQDRRIYVGKRGLLVRTFCSMVREKIAERTGNRGAQRYRIHSGATVLPLSAVWLTDILVSQPGISLEHLLDAAMPGADVSRLRKLGSLKNCGDPATMSDRDVVRRVLLSRLGAIERAGRLRTLIIPMQRYYTLRKTPGKSTTEVRVVKTLRNVNQCARQPETET